jgi:hypothetical protein
MYFLFPELRLLINGKLRPQPSPTWLQHLILIQ